MLAGHLAFLEYQGTCNHRDQRCWTYAGPVRLKATKECLGPGCRAPRECIAVRRRVWYVEHEIAERNVVTSIDNARRNLESPAVEDRGWRVSCLGCVFLALYVWCSKTGLRGCAKCARAAREGLDRSRFHGCDVGYIVDRLLRLPSNWVDIARCTVTLMTAKGPTRK
jgi:hypothetical protein